jgi:hypothetical protein
MWDEIAKGAAEGLVRGILARKPDCPSGQVDAQSFVLRDGQGRGRAILAMLDDQPGLILLNSAEEIKAQLGLNEKGAFLAMYGNAGQPGVVVRMEGDDPELVFFDANDMARASLRLYPTGPSLYLWDDQERCRVQVQMHAEAGPSVVRFDENEEPIQELRDQE